MGRQTSIPTRHRGLDACGELVTAATPAQLTVLLDLDLWRQAGRDHRFDVDRFGEWLGVLVDTGHSVAARTVAALDTPLVVAGLSRYVRVFDPGIFEPTAQSDDEPTDRLEAIREGDSLDVNEAMDAASMPAHHAPLQDSSGDGLECEVGGYLVRARRADAWDAIVTLLVALDADYGHCFHAVMQGCRRLSDSRSEVDGLDDLLLAPEQHLHDVTIERGSRAIATRLRDARRRARLPRDGATADPHAIRSVDDGGAQGQSDRHGVLSSGGPSTGIAARDGTLTGTHSGIAVVDIAVRRVPLERCPRPRDRRPHIARSGHGTPDRSWRDAAASARAARSRGRRPAGRQAHALAAADGVRPRHARDRAYSTRSRELAFLANTLLAGCSVQSRPFTPQEPSDAAAGICNLGLEYWPARWPSLTSPGASSPHPHDTATASPLDWLLIDHHPVTAFEVGWSVLHQDVGLFATEGLISTLTDVDCADRDIRRGLVALRRTLVKQRDAGTPWRAREAAGILARLDMTAWISVVGLLDECPVLPAALTAVLEGRTTTVSPTAFDFISTAAQVGDVRIFMRKLPDVLSL